MNARSLLVLLTLGVSPALFAHHSVPVNFDQSREITVEGVLTEVAWLNPHSHFRLDVTSADGSTVEWLIEMGSVNAMRRAGYPFERFVIGDEIVISGWPGRREHTTFLLEAVLSDGTSLVCRGGRCSPRSTADPTPFEGRPDGN